MQKLYKTIGIFSIVAVTVFVTVACSGNSSSRVINSADALKGYLNSQPANIPDKPIKVGMNINDLMLKDIVEVLNSAGKYVDLDFSSSIGLTTIGERAFRDCKALIGITIPDSVTEIGRDAFRNCINLSNITIRNSTSITKVGKDAFENCTNFAGFTVIGVDTSLNGIWINKENKIKEVYNSGNNDLFSNEIIESKSFYITKGGLISFYYYILAEYLEEEFHKINYSVKGNTLTYHFEDGDDYILTKQ